MIVIFFALLLAVLSTTVPDSFRSQPQPSHSVAAASQSEPITKMAQPQRRSLLLSESQGPQQRAYHPAFETSNSAGALGFWMLFSLCGLFLSAGLAPALFRTLRHPRR
jgi:hypothetical protein